MPLDLGARQAPFGADVERDILAGLNFTELGRRHFREIARVAGLVFQGFPAIPTAAPTAGIESLIYNVFAEYDRDNRLLKQAVREVLERRLEAPRLGAALTRLRCEPARLVRRGARRRSRSRSWWRCSARSLTNEALETRVARMVAELEEAAKKS